MLSEMQGNIPLTQKGDQRGHPEVELPDQPGFDLAVDALNLTNLRLILRTHRGGCRSCVAQYFPIDRPYESQCVFTDEA